LNNKVVTPAMASIKARSCMRVGKCDMVGQWRCYQLPVTSYQLPVTGFRLPVLYPVTGNR
jgi:hypothetical protein